MEFTKSGFQWMPETTLKKVLRHCECSLALLCPPKGSDGHLATDRRCLCQAKEHYPSSMWRQTREPSDSLQSHEHHPALYHVPAMGQNLGEHTEPLPPSKGITSASLSPDPGQASSVSASWAQVLLGLPLPR